MELYISINSMFMYMLCIEVILKTGNSDYWKKIILL